MNVPLRRVELANEWNELGERAMLRGHFHQAAAYFRSAEELALTEQGAAVLHQKRQHAEQLAATRGAA